MSLEPDPILESDLVAFVDRQLTPERRVAVAAHLAARPDEAARVMADIGHRDGLRLALGGSPVLGSATTAQAARRLEGRLRRRPVMRRVRHAAALASLIAIGWFAHAEIGPLGIRSSVASVPAPAFVEEALAAHRTAEVRAGMVSQPEVARFDPTEILAATAIAMPALPGDWQVRDVQIFPSPFGPSVEMAVETGDFGALSLFAVRPGRFDVIAPDVTVTGGATAAYWQIGDVAYALIAEGAERRDLERTAEALAQTLY